LEVENFLRHLDKRQQQLCKTKMSQTLDADMADAPRAAVEDGLAPGEVEEESAEKLIRIVSVLAPPLRYMGKITDT
jgi:hypothetical protein